jgi:hypothetical protein
MIRAEYVRFLQTLNAEGITAEECKIANLVPQHLDTLIPLSTAQGQRINTASGHRSPRRVICCAGC